MAKLRARISLIRTPQRRAVQLVQADGIISTPTVARFRKIMDKAVEAGRDIILDMAKVSYINSSGLAELVRVHDILEQKNLCFILTSLDTDVKRLVLMLGLRELLRVFPSARQALDGLDRGVIRNQSLTPGDTTRWYLQRGRAFVPVKAVPPPKLPDARIMLGMHKDDRFTRVLARSLSGSGENTLAVSSREEALRAMDGGKIDIAIIDTSLPEVEAIVADLKTSRKNGLVSVILIYGRGEGPQTGDARVCEDEYAVEPFEIREMIATAQGEYGRCSSERMLFVQEARLEMPTSESAVARGNRIVEHMIGQSGLDQHVGDGFFYAVREAVDNARIHGNLKSPSRRIEVLYILDREKITVTVTDQGRGFDSEAALKEARARTPIEQARERQADGKYGGLGIGLMLRCCDKIEYVSPGNSVRLTRYL